MARSDLAAKTCSAARAIEAVGDTWTLMILREMFLGTRRFDDFQTLTGCSPHILSVRLKRLQSVGIVMRHAYSEHPPRYEYHLTQQGEELWPVVITLKQWGDKWLGEPAETSVTLTHKGCGHVTRPYMVCSECAAPMTARDSIADPSPEFAAERRTAISN